MIHELDPGLPLPQTAFRFDPIDPQPDRRWILMAENGHELHLPIAIDISHGDLRRAPVPLIFKGEEAKARRDRPPPLLRIDIRTQGNLLHPVAIHIACCQADEIRTEEIELKVQAYLSIPAHHPEMGRIIKSRLLIDGGQKLVPSIAIHIGPGDPHGMERIGHHEVIDRLSFYIEDPDPDLRDSLFLPERSRSSSRIKDGDRP